MGNLSFLFFSPSSGIWENIQSKKEKKKEEKKSCFGTMSEETLSHCGEESFVLCKINDETNEEVYRSRN